MSQDMLGNVYRSRLEQHRKKSQLHFIMTKRGKTKTKRDSRRAHTKTSRLLLPLGFLRVLHLLNTIPNEISVKFRNTISKWIRARSPFQCCYVNFHCKVQIFRWNSIYWKSAHLYDECILYCSTRDVCLAYNFRYIIFNVKSIGR